MREVALLCVLFSACVGPLSSPRFQPASPPIASPVGEGTEKVAGAGWAPHAPPGVSYTTIAEVLKQPRFFDGQQVRLKGKVIDARHATFHLTDGSGNMIKVVAGESPRVREGSEVTVAGRLTIPHRTMSSGLPEVRDAQIVSVTSGRKLRVKPAVISQGEQVPSPPPAVRPLPPPSLEQDEGQVF